MNRITLATTAVAALAAGANAQFLFIPDSDADVVNIHSAQDGSAVELGAFDLNAAAAADNYTGSLTPIEARQVGSEVWVTDQLADRVWRFDATTRQPLGAIGGAGNNDGLLNNVRGFEVVGDTAFFATGSDGAFNEGIVSYDIPSNTLLGSTLGGIDGGDASFFDITRNGDELLVSNIDSGNDAILRFDLNLNLLGNFATSDGTSSFDFAQQVSVAANGDVLVSSFSLPSGVFRFAPDGTPQGIVAADGFGPRGNYELGNGEVLWTNGNFVQFDDNNILTGGSYRFITETSIPAPASATLLAAAAFATTRRRR